MQVQTGRRNELRIVGRDLAPHAQIPLRDAGARIGRIDQTVPVDEQRPHHLVVFMFDDVAVPDVEPGDVKIGLDAHDLAGIRNHRVLVALFIGQRRILCPGRDEVPECEGARIQVLALHHLETNLVQVDRMRIGGGIEDLPDFGAVEERGLGHRVAPPLRQGSHIADAVRRHYAQERHLRPHGFREVARNRRRGGRAVVQEIRVAREGAEERPDDVPVDRVDFDADLTRRQFVQGHLAGVGRCADRRQCRKNDIFRQQAGCIARLRQGAVDDKIHDLAAGERIRNVAGKKRRRREAAEGRIGSGVDHPDPRPVADAAEVDDDVAALCGHQEQRLAGIGGRHGCGNRTVAGKGRDEARHDLHDLGQESLIAAELVDRHLAAEDVIGVSGDAVGIAAHDEKRKVQRPRVAAVQKPQAIARRGHFEFRPGRPVYHHRVEEGLRVPDSVDVRRPGRRSGPPDEGAGETVEEGAVLRIEEGAVGVERSVLNRNRYLPDCRTDRSVEVRIATRKGRRRAGQNARGRVVRTAADEPETGRTGIDVQPGHAEGMVMVPDGRRGLGVLVTEIRRPGDGIGDVRLAVVRPLRGVAGRDVVGGREPPRLGVPVAVRLDVGAVDMGHDGHRSRIGRRNRRLAVGAVRVAHGAVGLGRVGPVHGLIDGEQLRQIIPACVDQAVDPAHGGCSL